MQKAVVVSYNWDTNEILFTDFDGPDAGKKAGSWVDKESFIWKDFPASDGWTHFMTKNKECVDAEVNELLGALGKD